jgi:hypothetical protein
MHAAERHQRVPAETLTWHLPTVRMPADPQALTP